jgi:putative ABC transport system substrate-binding protein
MAYAFKRLALGLTLIALASAILLMADVDRRTADRGRTVRLAIMQHVESRLMEDGVRGVLEGLAARGYRHGENGVTIDRFNAQGDMATSAAIAGQLVGAGYDLVITSSTPSMQAVANANKEGRARHVFALVADPFAAGVGLDRAQPLTHPPHMVGQGSFPPVDTAFEYARRMLPSLTRVGVAWNPAESNSLAFIQRGRAVASRMGLTLLEANADSTAAVGDAIASLIARDAQAIWVGGDNTLAAAIDSVIALARRNRVPIFSVLPGPPDRGTLFDTGFDFVEVGRQGGALAADVLEGADLTKLPIADVGDLVEPFLSVNTKALDGLREKWHVPEDLLTSANVVVDSTGVHRRAAKAGSR